jgi:polyferredoxin
MKSATRSKKRAVIAGVLIGGFSFYWYFNPFPWLGAIMGVLFGSLVYFTLSTRRMERFRRAIFIGFFALVGVAVLVIILNMGTSTFIRWAQLTPAVYYLPGQTIGSSNFPDTRLIPQTLLGAATYKEGIGWQTKFASSLGDVFMYLVPYFLTILILGKAICGWLCPYGGLTEAFVTGRKERWKMRMFTKQATTEGGFRYAGLKQWVHDSRYWLLLAVILLSIFFAFPLINIFSPWLWLKNWSVFWLIMVIIAFFMIFLPFMTKRRWFCLFCPVGAVTSLFNKISLFRIKIDQGKCTECMDCVQECRMYAMTPQDVEQGKCTSIDCIRCGRCIEVCPEEAVDMYWLGSSKKARSWLISLAIFAVSAWGVWFVIALVDILQRRL